MISLHTWDLRCQQNFFFSSRPEINRNFFIPNTTPDEVMNSIKILLNKMSAGHDNISYKVCKVSGSVLAKPLADIFIQGIKEDTFLTFWN